MQPSRPNSQGQSASGQSDLPLELDDVASQDKLAKQHRQTQAAPKEEDLTDLTFTKPGQTLLTKKSTYDRLRGTGKSRASWKQMRDEVAALGNGRQLVVWAVAGTLALVLVLWLARMTYRGITYVAAAGTSLARGVTATLEPNLAELKDVPQKVVDKANAILKEARVSDEELALPTTPKRAQNQEIDGEAWPGRNQDQLTSEELVEPTALVAKLLQQKGSPLTNTLPGEVRGVFHTDSAELPEKPLWIGDFVIMKERGKSPTIEFDGTLMHHTDEDSSYVARFTKGMMQHLWHIKGPPQKRRIFYSRMAGAAGKFIPDGAAFVLDQHRTLCLALDYKMGELVGGQWCTKRRDDNDVLVYNSPSTIANPSALQAEGEDFGVYVGEFDEAMGQADDISRRGLVELRKFQKRIPRGN